MSELGPCQDSVGYAHHIGVVEKVAAHQQRKRYVSKQAGCLIGRLPVKELANDAISSPRSKASGNVQYLITILLGVKRAISKLLSKNLPERFW